MEFVDGQKELTVIVGRFLFVVEVRHGAERLHVVFGVSVSIKAAGHEVGAAVLFEKAAFGHVDSGVFGHQVIGVFDAAIILCSAQLSIFSHSIEFEQPVFVPWIHVELAGAYLIGGGVPCDGGFGARAAGGGADLDDLV